MGIFSEAGDVDRDASEIIRDILARYSNGQISVVRARSALTAFVTSLAPDDFFNEEGVTALDVYLDITLEVSRRAATGEDQMVEDRILLIKRIANGDIEARKRLTI